jgi:sugar phosphate isomerase/epimerase
MSIPDLLASYWTICGAAEPHTDHEFSPFGLRERAASAARAGFKGLGIWHADLAHLRSKHSLAEMKSILADHGIVHLELEFLTDWFVDGEKRKASDVNRRMLLESAAALGARHIKVGDFFKTAVPMPKLIEEFVKLCQDAREHGTRIVFEFMPFSRIDTLEDAIELVTGAAQPNGGICVDLWHVVKLGIPYAKVAAFPKPYLLSIEINDGFLQAPAGMDMVTETTCHRAFCGEGQFDVHGFVSLMSNAGYAGPWGIEVLNQAQRAWALDDLTSRAHATTARQFLRGGGGC